MSDPSYPDGVRPSAPTALDPDMLVPLPRAFYDRPVLEVATDAIGSILVHRSADGIAAGRIVEVEAYRGPEDLASHSAGGKRTKRNEAMWGPPGHVYMFLLYGVNWAFNLVTGKEGEPHAVLVRAVEPLPPFQLMADRRGMAPEDREITNGPGKLCAALGLDGDHYGVDLCATAQLFLALGRRGEVARSPRINIDYAGDWVDKPWRFYERGNRYVSVKPRD
ncbi:MAG: DNA-3-methyladenine glycosylase [Deltaproteobacteria bacterium]|nr:DNA-3-methyladenine glycosylase [Deltaproteobacteria bacterium]